jgi:predicted nucleic acid-binding Zn ribbon protein
MQRDPYNTVTISILIPVSPDGAEGETFYDERIRVRRFTARDMDRASDCGKQTWNQVPEWQKAQILNVVAVIRALESDDRVAAERAILALKENTGSFVLGIVKASLKEPGFLQDTLVKDLCNRLDSVRVVLWKTQERIAPGILCPDVPTAFFVHVLMSAVGAKASLRLCPKCGKIFMQKRADQDYCSVKCREAHRVERWRTRKAEITKLKPKRSPAKRRKAQ